MARRSRAAFWLALLGLLPLLVALAATLRPEGGVSAASLAKIDPAVLKELNVSPSVRVIVSLRANTPRGIAPVRAAVLDGVPRSEFSPERTYRSVPALAGEATAQGVAGLAAQPGVERISPALPIEATLMESSALIGADTAHDILGVTGAGVTVAVLDTGIDTDHPLLSDDIAYQRCFLVDATCPAGGTSSMSAEDNNGHGTLVSGIVTSNGPPQGIAPDAGIAAYKVLGASGAGDFADVLSAYDDIITNHPEVDVINMSLAAPGAYAPDACDPFIPAFAAAIMTARTMGIVSFAASGNGGSKTGIGYPACVGGIASVGAVYDADLGALNWPPCSDTTTAPDQVACFSQSHPQLSLLAPGGLITATGLGGGLTSGSGTSFSSPMAAGAAALLLESEPALAPDALVTRLRETGTPVTDAGNGVTTCRIDVYEAVVNDGGPVCASSGPPAPINDNFINASAFGPGLPQTASQSTAYATTEGGEPAPCAGIASTVWFRFTPAASGVVVADTVGSLYDTALSVYQGDTLATLLLLDCNDDTAGVASQVEFSVSSGTTYYIQVGGFLGAVGQLTLHLGAAPPTPTPLPTKQPLGDTDGDGCSDTTENGLDQEHGGRRDYLNPWDFYDTNADGTIDLFLDIFAVAMAFGSTPEDPGYSQALDRSSPPTAAQEPDPSKREPWDMRAPDGQIALFVDIFGIAAQFGHKCS